MLRKHSMTLSVIFIICLMLLVIQSAPSQVDANAARKFDEFGDIQYSDIIARLDNFAIQLQNEPSTRGFIIVYRTRRDLPGLSNRLALWMKNYMVMTRGISAERVVTVDGGVASCFTQELWIVPIGKAPTPRTDAYNNSFVDPDTARKFDEHYYALPGESFDGNSYEDLSAFLDAFATELRKEPSSSAYIIAYSQYYIERGSIGDAEGRQRAYERVHLDPPSTAGKILMTERNFLVKTYGIAQSRIKIMNGGYRNLRQVELWIVPRGADTPVPTPNRFPKRRSRN
jgi:hypothetical protein